MGIEKISTLLICRIALAISWIYQGAVPKLMCQSSGELQLLGHIIPIYKWACLAVQWMGYGEIVFGIVLLLASWQWLFWLNIAALIGLLAFVALFEPAMLTLPFNPLTLNVALIALSLIALREMKRRRY